MKAFSGLFGVKRVIETAKMLKIIVLSIYVFNLCLHAARRLSGKFTEGEMPAIQKGGKAAPPHFKESFMRKSVSLAKIFIMNAKNTSNTALYAACGLLFMAHLQSFADSGLPGIPEERRGSSAAKGLLEQTDAFGEALMDFYQFAHAVSLRSQTWIDEAGLAHLGIRNKGDGRFYRLVTMGGRFHDSRLTWSVGYGFGGRMQLGAFSITVDGLAQLLNTDGLLMDRAKVISRSRIAGGVKLFDAFTAFAGVSLNDLRWSAAPLTDTPDWKPDYAVSGGAWNKPWPGFFIGIRR